MPIERVINEPPQDLSSYTILIGGPKKIGKTSFAAEFPDSHIAEFEVGNALHLRCSFTDIPTLQEFQKWLNEAKQTTWVKTWVLDEITKPYDWIHADLCKREGVLDPSEIPHGKLWGAIRREYVSKLDQYFSLAGGKILTTHASQKTVKTVTKQEITTYECEYGATIRKGLVDPRIHNVWLMDYLENGRVLILQGDNYYKASTANLLDNFKTPSGRSIKMIPLGTHPKQGYENVLACYNNEMELEEEYLVPEDTHKPVVESKPKLSFGK